ncbi:unnamed protein product [Triticum turgidum subsp. durum]|uniref:Uncharacterized protein n=1 Tax=Triticum turgidum subsp. durum TaxID=4567 RepID=A0A9R1PQ58_TRITD|nr:unnamed protein product [Triticum turgidum subsp. durum]
MFVLPLLLQKRLGDDPRAHSLLLSEDNEKLKFNLETIHPSSTSYGGAYTTALPLGDSMEVFGDESCYTSELFTGTTK